MANKHLKKEEIEEEKLISDVYCNITGTNKKFIIRTLKNIDKAPRIIGNFRKILSTIESKKETSEPDVYLDDLIKQLSLFIPADKDDRKKASFNDYSNKFVLYK